MRLNNPTTRGGGAPLRAYLLGLTALFVLTAGGAVWFGWLRAQQDGLAAARADARFAADKAARKIGDGLTTVRQTVDTVASAPGAAEVYTDPAACRLSFSLGSADAGHLDLLRPDGTVACSSRPPADAADAAAYRGAAWLAAANREPQLTGPVPDARTGRPAVLVAAPLPGLGSVVAMVDLAALGTDAAQTFGGARELEFLVLGADGATVLTRWPDPARWSGRPVGGAFAAPGPAGDGTDVTGVRRVYGQAAVPGRGWAVYAGADRSAALAAERRSAGWQAVIAAIGLAAGLLATLLVYRRITRPIGRLRAAVHRAADTGDLDAEVTVAGPREVRALGAEFAALLGAVERELAERRQAEEAARGHERNYRQMFDTNPNPIYLFEPGTLRLVAVNDAAVAYFGRSREALLDLTVPDLCPGDDAAAVEQAMAAAGAVDRCRRLRHLRRDGTVADVELTSHVTVFAGRTVRCAVVDDVTEREQLQRRLRQSERLESLGQLAGGIAHDFNNLLGIINGYAGMCATDVEELAPDEPEWRRLRADLLEIVAAGDRAAGLTRQLLAFARADSVLELRVVDVNTVVTDVERLLRRTLGEDIALRTDLTGDPALVKGDVGRLEQILVNLAVNARDAMPQGGALTIDTDVVAVDDHYAAQHPGARPGRYVRLRVSDTGVGMSRETLERAFEPFFTTKPVGHGTGLGLATIYGIVTQLGGHAQIYSEPGHGTTVGVLLPVTEETADAAGAAAPAPEPGTGQTILLVEDDESLRALTERILHGGGYTVLSASLGAEARALAREHDVIDLLLTDVVMPDMHGPDLAAALHADRPDLRVLYMSGYAETILAARSTLPGGTVLLNKPVTAHQLLSAVARELRARSPLPR